VDIDTINNFNIHAHTFAPLDMTIGNLVGLLVYGTTEMPGRCWFCRVGLIQKKHIAAIVAAMGPFIDDGDVLVGFLDTRHMCDELNPFLIFSLYWASP
jgi:hypothetical protein